LIRELEKLEIVAYADPKTKGKPYTNGYGSTRKKDGSPWKLGERTTPEEAEELLWHQLTTEFLPVLESTIPTWGQMNAYQRAAIISAAWNLGANFYGAKNKDTITRCLSNVAYFPGVPAALRLYIDPGTSVEEGLRNRREKEIAVWNRGSDLKACTLEQIRGDMLLTELKPAQVVALHEALELRGFKSEPTDGKLTSSVIGAWEKFKASQYLGSPDRIGPASIGLLLNPPIAVKTPSSPQKRTLADRIYECCRQRGYPLDQRPGATNIIGLEGINPDGTPNDDAHDKWNDTIAVLTFDKGRPKLLGAFLGTTEPGRSATISPPNPNGVARLDTGYHKGLWAKGKHRGYDALVQVGAARIVRDRNRNASRDDKVTIESGNGINLHTTKTTGWKGSAALSSVGPWSAGCVVAYNSVEYAKELLPMLQLGLQGRNNERFDFILLWRDWLKDV
jgi:GH24 family phage-related lysozyme (muramidase)